MKLILAGLVCAVLWHGMDAPGHASLFGERWQMLTFEMVFFFGAVTLTAAGVLL